MAPVHLRDARLIDRFHAFIFSNQASRARHIYGLKLPRPLAYDSPVVDKFRLDSQLLALLEAAVYIQYLELPSSTRPSVFDACLKLTTVRELNVYANDGRAPLCAHLNAFQSPLRVLRVTGGSGNFYDFVSASFLHDSLGHLLPTLEVLDLDYFPITIPPAKITTPFLAVRSLKVKSIFGLPSDSLAVLLRLFPKLDNELEIGSWNSRAEEAGFHTIQEQSREVQNTHGTWSGIDHLVCDPRTALLMALQCPIRRMSTMVIWPYAWKELSDALRHNSPRQLHVSVELDAGFGGLDGLFPAEAAGTLTHLVVFAHFGVNYRCGARRKANNVHWNRFIDRLVGSIQHLRLTHIRIVFRSFVNHSAQTPPRDGERLGPVCGVDILSAATRFIDVIPSLQYLFLTVCGHTYLVPASNTRIAFERQPLDSWFSSSAWQVANDNSNSLPRLSDASLSSSFVELSEEDQERIMDLEELHLSPDEEHELRQCAWS